ncbi:MAG: adenylosuccinate lyase [Pirellulaceae bacterium]|nr:adenylosuccinate lyase [Pirellulaceae bacterium]
MSNEFYQNPLIARYASEEMSRNWGDQKKFSTWRRLWIALAESERELGIDISGGQIAEMKASVDEINFDLARDYEKKLRHDVMAHVHAFGDQCPSARPVIHLGATSCFITDNTDLILIRDALELVEKRLARVISNLGSFARKFRDLACLGYTHLQPAQPTTVGKRACLWAYDFVMDLEEIQARIRNLKARSTKGTTGTQASFLKLFQGNHGKCRDLESAVARRMGFQDSYAVTGQTYSRKVDAQLVDTLSGIAGSSHKFATDLRILAHKKEMEEPFEKNQIGSSAMAYKRNPMRSERVCALARFVMSLQSSASNTLAVQWMERTLDDSANRRLTLPQAFLGIDSILLIMENVTSGLVVYPAMCQKHLSEELPYMETENILMEAVAAGGDRQDLHERIRIHSVACANQIKVENQPNDLLDRIRQDEAFAGVDLERSVDPLEFVGRSREQVDDFCREVIEPIEAGVDSNLEEADLRV